MSTYSKEGPVFTGPMAIRYRWSGICEAVRCLWNAICGFQIAGYYCASHAGENVINTYKRETNV